MRAAGDEDGHAGYSGTLDEPRFIDTISHQVIDQSSIVRVIEQNWSLPALGNGAADAAAGSILARFDFRQRLIRPSC